MADLGEIVSGFTPPPRPGPPVIGGRLVRLEALDPDRHGAALHAAFAGADAVWDYLPYGPFRDAAGYRVWLDSVAGKPDPFFYALCDAQTGQAAGVASFLRTDIANGVIEVGHINLSPRLQRSPAATEAMALMMGWAFDAGYRRYEWKCNALNAVSRRAAERLGLSFEGVFRQAAVVKGRNRDTAWFALIDKDWPRVRAALAAWLDPANFHAAGGQRQSLSALTGSALVSRDPSRAGR
jgi:RimJ/RimL family protein N-acetyltransferase